MGVSRWLKMVVAIAAAALVLAAEAQQTPSCASKLVPCAPYLNSTKPPPVCCNPLREAVEKEKDCLCNLYDTPGLLAGLGVNVTQALILPRYCNISSDTSSCKNKTASPPKSSILSPPATPAGNSTSEGGKIISTGAFSLLLMWVCVMLH